VGVILSILDNAINSIIIGLEDYDSLDEKKLIYSVRNIFAGILLLFKYKLSELSPAGSNEVLVKQKLLPVISDEGVLKWVGTGRKTVDVFAIKERFISLGINTDWKKVDQINKYRNDIEHYFSTLTELPILQLMSDSFLVIRDFIHDELNKDPKELLGYEYWTILVDANENYKSEVYKKEKQKLDFTIDQLEFFNDEIAKAFKAYCCCQCSSELLGSLEKNGPASYADFKCRSCDTLFTYEEIVDSVVVDYFGKDVFLSKIKGQVMPLENCSSCCNGIYISNHNICASCGYSGPNRGV
jgi:hypothetical protein